MYDLPLLKITWTANQRYMYSVKAFEILLEKVFNTPCWPYAHHYIEMNWERSG